MLRVEYSFLRGSLWSNLEIHAQSVKLSDLSKLLLFAGLMALMIVLLFIICRVFGQCAGVNRRSYQRIEMNASSHSSLSLPSTNDRLSTGTVQPNTSTAPSSLATFQKPPLGKKAIASSKPQKYDSFENNDFFIQGATLIDDDASSVHSNYSTQTVDAITQTDPYYPSPPTSPVVKDEDAILLPSKPPKSPQKLPSTPSKKTVPSPPTTPGSNEAHKIALTTYLGSVDAYIRSRDDFYAPNYFYNIDRLRNIVPISKDIKLPVSIHSLTPSSSGYNLHKAASSAGMSNSSGGNNNTNEQPVNAGVSRHDYVAFLRQQTGILYVNTSQTSVSLVALTPYRGPDVVNGAFHCVAVHCKHRWTSAASRCDTYELCPRCRAKVYPHHQWPLSSDAERSSELAFVGGATSESSALNTTSNTIPKASSTSSMTSSTVSSATNYSTTSFSSSMLGESKR